MALSYEEAVRQITQPGQMLEIAPHQIDGTTIKVWKNFPSTIPQLVGASLGFGEREWLVYGGERMSYERHYRQVAALGRRLAEDFGVEKGDRVAIAMRNYPEWSIAFWAARTIWGGVGKSGSPTPKEMISTPRERASFFFRSISTNK